MKRSLAVIVGGSVVVGVLAALAVVSIRRFGAPAEPVFDALSPNTQDAFLKLEQRWVKNAEWVDADIDSELLAAAWRPVVIDKDDLVPPETESELREWIARFASAYSRELPDNYEHLIDSTPWRQWREGVDELMNITSPGAVYDYVFKTRPDPEEAGDAKALLEIIWRRIMRDDNHRFREIGQGQGGAVLIIERTYSRTSGAGLEALSGDWASYWGSAPAHANAVGFTKPPPSLGGLEHFGEALPTFLEQRQLASVVIANCHVLVRSAKDVMFVWHTRWILDPDTNMWILDFATRAMGRSAYVLF